MEGKRERGILTDLFVGLVLELFVVHQLLHLARHLADVSIEQLVEIGIRFSADLESAAKRELVLFAHFQDINVLENAPTRRLPI